jgi:hypothetical protein
MATFQNEFIFKLIDKISPKLKKIEKQMAKTTDKIKRQTAKAGESFTKLGSRISDVGKKMMSLGTRGLITVTAPLALLGRTFINAASNYEEAVNKVDVAFGSASQSVKDFAKTAGENFGIDRGRALDMAALFGDMATGMGINQDKAAGLSKKLVALSGDMASFKNVKIEQVKTAFAGIFTGEPEALKKMGIVQTIENLEEFARGIGIVKKVSDMTQAEKVMLRFNFLLDKSKNSIGDFLRTQNSYANSVRKMQTNFNNLSISFGQRMLPTATKFANVLGDIFLKINKISPQNKDLIIKIGALVAAIAPLLIALGALAVAMKLLIIPGAMLAVKFAAIGGALFGLYKIVELGINIFTNFDNTINKIITTVTNLPRILTEAKNNLLQFIGIDPMKGKFDEMARRQQAAAAKFKLDQAAMNQSFTSNTMINSRNKTDISGNIAVEILSAEKTRTKMTPAKNSPVGFTGKNTIIGGSY